MSAPPTAPVNPVDAFASSLLGFLVRQGDANYEEYRFAWNGHLRAQPKYIALCKGVSDVVKCINFARENKLPIAARGGGHSMRCLVQDGLVVDLRFMNNVFVDKATKRVRASAGALLGQLDAETAAYNIVVPAGAVSHTGIGGLSLIGGIGWLSRSYGLTADNILSVEIVNSEGKIMTVSATENSDLFWGIKGAGSSFGIVTSFEYQGHTLKSNQPLVFGAALIFPYPRAVEIIVKVNEINRTVPNELAVYIALGHGPDGNPCCIVQLCYNGNENDAKAATKPFYDLGPVMVQGGGMLPFAIWQTSIDALAPHKRNYYDSGFSCEELNEDLAKLLVEHYLKYPTKLGVFLLELLGGKVAEIPLESAAISWRNVRYNCGYIGAWDDPKDEAAILATSANLKAALVPFRSPHVYANYDPAADVASTENYSAEVLKRLRDLKAKYDPTNMFHCTVTGRL